VKRWPEAAWTQSWAAWFGREADTAALIRRVRKAA
jgi:hypothetical protein